MNHRDYYTKENEIGMVLCDEFEYMYVILSFSLCCIFAWQVVRFISFPFPFLPFFLPVFVSVFKCLVFLGPFHRYVGPGGFWI